MLLDAYFSINAFIRLDFPAPEGAASINKLPSNDAMKVLNIF
ncbi:hypothetical protein ALTERO38_20101 [Alteromonas sp. 38]|nr:hypothetical protein ALTERO38_20101 [Alteromonas sp. 38]